MKKSEHIESRLNSRNIRIIYLCFDHNLLRFSGFCSEFWPKKDLPRSQYSVTKDSAPPLMCKNVCPHPSSPGDKEKRTHGHTEEALFI